MYHIERYHDFSYGHRVHGHETKCKHLHGHNGRVTFTVTRDHNQLDLIGRVLDFSAVKSRLCQWLEDNWDHKMLIWEGDPLGLELCDLDPDGIVLTSFNPTAENMAQYLVDEIGPKQLKGTGCVLVRCRVDETRKCSATYEVSE